MESISQDGMSIKTNSSLPNSNEYTIRIHLPDTDVFVEASVKKIWELIDNRIDSSCNYGFVFTKLRSIDYRAISKLIELQTSKSQQTTTRRSNTERRIYSQTPTDSTRRKTDRRWSLPTYPLYINGRDIDTGVYEYFAYADKQISEPKATSEIMLQLKNGEMPPEASQYIYGRCCVGDEKYNSEALVAAKHAFKTYSLFPLSKRMKILDDIHKLLLKKKEELLQLFIAEGHPRKLGEWEFSGMIEAYTAEMISFYKSEVANTKKHQKKSSDLALLVRRPDGVICVSPPRNAAASNSLTGGLTLLGGNTLVVKPPLTLPIATIFLWRNVVDTALRMNGAPLGTLNIVVGNTAKFINQWINDPIVNDIIYFGESDRGLDIGKRIYSAGKKPILELSGKDIMLIWENSDLESAADSLADCFLGSTQICMVPKMALIHESIYDRFEQIFIEKVKKLKPGLPSDPDTCLSPVSKIGSFISFLEDSINKGAKLVYGAQRLNHKGMPDGKGVYIEPTVIKIDEDEKIYDFRCIKEEIFFPLLPLVKVSSKPNTYEHKSLAKNEIIFNKMADIVNKNPYGLRVSIWCSSDSRIRRFIREIHNCGLLRINCRHVDFSMYMATHGGTGKTGGPYGELNYFWQRATHLQGINIKR